MKPVKFFVFMMMVIFSMNTFAGMQFGQIEILDDEAYLQMEIPTLPTEAQYEEDMKMKHELTGKPIEEIILANSIPREIDEAVVLEF